MIVRNESAHLQRCLRSVSGVADDVVVVDTGSTDGTVDIAQREGARVFHFAWVDDFAKARNHSLDQARAPWILVLDADEQLVEKDRERLVQLIASRQPDTAFNLVVNNSVDGGRTGMLAHVLRLFPNRPDVRYAWPIHEQVGTSLIKQDIPIEDTSIEILHDGYSDRERNTGKQRRNLAILEKQVAAGDAVGLTYFLKAGAHLDLGDFENALACYKRCIQLSVTKDPFVPGCRVRIPYCLMMLGRHAEACSAITKPTHPEEWLVLGKCRIAQGQTSDGMQAFRALLAMDEGVFMPPCDLTTLKLEAVMSLATLLKAQGKPAEALQLMRDALSRRQSGQLLDAAWLRSTGL
jgi:tetratricopeptide (TPR) repeat protein